MNLLDLNLEDLDELAVRQMVFETNELTPILKGHLFIERVLEILIRRNLTNPENFLKQQLSFSLKLSLVTSFGVLPNKLIEALKN